MLRCVKKYKYNNIKLCHINYKYINRLCCKYYKKKGSYTDMIYVKLHEKIENFEFAPKFPYDDHGELINEELTTDGDREEDTILGDVVMRTERRKLGLKIVKYVISLCILSVFVLKSSRRSPINGVSVIRVPFTYVASYVVSSDIFEDMNSLLVKDSIEIDNNNNVDNNNNNNNVDNNDNAKEEYRAEYKVPLLFTSLPIVVYVTRRVYLQGELLNEEDKTLRHDHKLRIDTSWDLYLKLRRLSSAFNREIMLPVGWIHNIQRVICLPDDIVTDIKYKGDLTKFKDEAFFIYADKIHQDEYEQCFEDMKADKLININDWCIDTKNENKATIIDSKTAFEIAVPIASVAFSIGRMITHYHANLKFSLENTFGDQQLQEINDELRPSIQEEQNIRNFEKLKYMKLGNLLKKFRITDDNPVVRIFK